jgi:transposase
VIASVSRETGVELLKIYRTAINAEKFINYLEGLRKKNGHIPLAIFMD